ncbi:hypothetical protein M3F38_003221 [Escherichia coli]|nr:hypothetical protein [Escherichia coli]EFH5352573.1 hypothetical protein [Escherichia coli]EFU2672719.1 hypothetical protein [Escherichia coli]EHT6559802.1 hypothetical protein [Escherichia coli]EIL3212685.1 hypothetical protein [Escherichia coli]
MEIVPWERLMTSYGTAAEIPHLLAKWNNKSFKRIAELLEHQGTFWQATPWVVQWLVEHYPNYRDPQPIYHLFALLSKVLYWRMEKPGIPRLQDQKMLLNEERLMPEKCSSEELEIFLEDYDISETEFGSYYYFTLQQIRRLIPLAQECLQKDNSWRMSACEFLEAINPKTFSATCIFYPKNKGGRTTLPDLFNEGYIPHLKLAGNETAYGIVIRAAEKPHFKQRLSVKITCLYRDLLDYTPLLDAEEGQLYEGQNCVGNINFQPIFITSTENT